MQTQASREHKHASWVVKLWQHPAVQQRWVRLRHWITRALEKLADGG